MTSRDWDFIIGDFGNPLADIKDWMLRPHPQCLIDKGVYDGHPEEEDVCQMVKNTK